MEGNIKVFGKMIANMALGCKYGLMEVVTKGNSKWEPNMEKENIYGQEVVYTREIGYKTESQALEFIYGKIIADTKDNG